MLVWFGSSINLSEPNLLARYYTQGEHSFSCTKPSTCICQALAFSLTGWLHAMSSQWPMTETVIWTKTILGVYWPKHSKSVAHFRLHRCLSAAGKSIFLSAWSLLTRTVTEIHALWESFRVKGQHVLHVLSHFCCPTKMHHQEQITQVSNIALGCSGHACGSLSSYAVVMNRSLGLCLTRHALTYYHSCFCTQRL